MRRLFLLLIVTPVLLPVLSVQAQVNGDFSTVRAEVDFSNHLREWNGFGVNYVECPQSMDYKTDPEALKNFGIATSHGFYA